MTTGATSTLADVDLAIPDYDPVALAGDSVFVPEVAGRVLGFFGDCLVHVKGDLAGRKVILRPWQQAIVANLFGWLRPDGTRRYRECLIYIPRKNGKTLLASGLALYSFFCDGEPGAEVYCAAADRNQARLLWDVARDQIRAEPALREACRIYQHSIVIESMGSSFRAISAEASTKHGFNAHFVVVDELHAQPNRELVDVLTTSMGSRRQPMIVYLTTADFEGPSICNEKLAYAKRVRDGVIDDPSFLPVIYEAALDDDYTSPAVWAKANPNLGVSLVPDYLARECARAKEQPSYLNTFRRLHLNIKTQADVQWMDVVRWDGCVAAFRPEDLRGKDCFGGLDLSSTSDLSAFVLYFPDGHYVLPFFFVPQESARIRERRDRVPYLAWGQEGHLRFTEGNVVDYDVIRREVAALYEVYAIREVGFDRWGATQLCNQLVGDGLDMVPFGQGYASFSAPSKELEKLVLSKRLQHNGHPVLRWCVSNAMVETDAAGNIKPSKRKSREKIDGVVALVMAIGRAIEQEQEIAGTYEGVTVLC